MKNHLAWLVAVVFCAAAIAAWKSAHDKGAQAEPTPELPLNVVPLNAAPHARPTIDLGSITIPTGPALKIVPESTSIVVTLTNHSHRPIDVALHGHGAPNLTLKDMNVSVLQGTDLLYSSGLDDAMASGWATLGPGKSVRHRIPNATLSERLNENSQVGVHSVVDVKVDGTRKRVTSEPVKLSLEASKPPTLR